MKLINKSLAFLSLVSLGFSSLEAKSIEFFLDHKIKETFFLQDDIPNSHAFQQLKVENIGERPIRNCFPHVNQSPTLSLEELGAKLAKERYPLLALYQLWQHSMIRDESMIDEACHPLDLLNFKGICTSKTFYQQFLKLCHALGIEVRLANVQGKQVYDFGLDDEWNFLDLVNNQLYLGLDNEKLASSEEVLDDPFLALRAKQSRQAKEIDFRETWKQLAAFNIIDSPSDMSLIQENDKWIERARGVDLYPGEALIFETSAMHSEIASHACVIEHRVNLNTRPNSRNLKYHSLFPIQRLVNKSTTSIRLIDQAVELQPGDSLTFQQPVFEVNATLTEKAEGQLILSGTGSWTLFPSLVKGKNKIHLGTKKNQTRLSFHYETNEALEQKKVSAPSILNSSHSFDYCSPQFLLNAEQAEKIWWQIGLDRHFQLIPSNFDQVQESVSTVSLPLISETFLNPGSTYYFRAKAYCNGQWSDWSTSFAFTVNKPDKVEGIIFEENKKTGYELNWERYAEKSNDSIEYLVFGSNSLDFIPSIYCDKQINAIVNGDVTEEEINDNLIAVTKEPKIQIPGHLAYYRIIARQHGQLSVPSAIVHVYDQDLVQPRNVLQVVKDEKYFVAKRMLLPSSPWSEPILPRISRSAKFEQKIVKLQSFLRAARSIDAGHRYELPNVSEETWEEVRPYLLPDNHPAWPKLNRIFCRVRATQSPEHFKRAGFRRWQPGRWSRVAASSHPDIPEYFIKAYCDIELGILYDWRKWIHRIKGAETIRNCINANNMKANFKVPHKWIYPLPKHPAPSKSPRYLRKNFILVCENMMILDHNANEKKYKYEMTPKLMKGLYIILQVCGLYDSVYVFNMPFCKDGRIAIIDTEYHHKWPVPYSKLTKYFPKKLQPYWEKLTYKGGQIPDGQTEFNPPRMDRRDIPKIDPMKTKKK